MVQRLALLLSLSFFACSGGTEAKEPTTAPGHTQGDHRHGEHADKPGHGHGAHAPLGHRFEDADEWAKRFEDPERDAWQKPAEVVELMRIEPGMHIADIGAGTGYFLPLLSKAAGEEGSVVGLDIEKDMVRYMIERAEREGLGNVTARVVPTDDAELAPESTDRILIVDTWHHIPNRGAYTKKLATALRPKGSVIIVDFTMETHRGPPKAHRPVSYTHLTLPTICFKCRSRWSPDG